MIYIGLTGWGDHDDLYQGIRSNKLPIYSSHFPIVEVDSSFYAVQPTQNYRKWLQETPSSFRFIVKAYQGMTGHLRGEIPFSSREDMFEAFIQSIEPLLQEQRLAMVLFQFPPWFDCKQSNVQLLRDCKERMGKIPVALEFRNQSWFSPKYRDKTLDFMKNEGWIHSICDEPQAGTGSVPTILEPTDKKKTLIRFHGRNVHGWNDTGDGRWREVRYLYKYSTKELKEWATHINELAKRTEELFIVFNNNSGGDAAINAKELQNILGIEFSGLAPRQLSLFEE